MPDAIWHHVRSKDNSAVLVWRGCTISDLNGNTIWWHGPKWLKESHVLWTSVSEILPRAEEPTPEEITALVTVQPEYE